ncbi:phospholipase D-like domain-containing protein [Streptomyces tsukubensis]|uniref:phospholipase D-like domain-containing protein n=1 Tax=Streptomyces tsukubensis TaxID=83656 RepID=UPI00344E513E
MTTDDRRRKRDGCPHRPARTLRGGHRPRPWEPGRAGHFGRPGRAAPIPVSPPGPAAGGDGPAEPSAHPWSVRIRSFHIAALALMSVLLTLIAAPPAAAAPGICSEQGNYEVCVTYGGPGNADTLIPRKIKAKIDATATTPQSGDYIRVAMYTWDNSGYGTEIADSLVRAAQNGVSVRIVVGSVDQTLRTKFVNAGIDLRTCPDACMKNPDGTWSGAMHNKFFVIRKGATELVLQTSANLSDWQARHAQNLLIVRDDPALFAGYVNYWRRLYDQDWTWSGTTWGDDDKSPYGTNGNSRAYFFPQYTKQPLVGVLAGVTDCATGNDRIWMEASIFDNSDHSRDIIAQLNRLRGIGCDIKVVVQEAASRNLLLANGVPGTDISCDGWHHNKLLVIDAKYGGAWNKAVFTGSYNPTANSNYRANDAMLRVMDGWVTNRYIDQFRQLWTNPRTCDTA